MEAHSGCCFLILFFKLISEQEYDPCWFPLRMHVYEYWNTYAKDLKPWGRKNKNFLGKVRKMQESRILDDVKWIYKTPWYGHWWSHGATVNSTLVWKFRPKAEKSFYLHCKVASLWWHSWGWVPVSSSLTCVAVTWVLTPQWTRVFSWLPAEEDFWVGNLTSCHQQTTEELVWEAVDWSTLHDF